MQANNSGGWCPEGRPPEPRADIKKNQFLLYYCILRLSFYFSFVKMYKINFAYNLVGSPAVLPDL
jgi:hypothetical protein